MEIAPWIALGVVGYFVCRLASNTNASLKADAPASAEPTGPLGYCEPSNEVVDPTLLMADRGRHPVVQTEPGPFGTRRFLQHDIGGYQFPTAGPSDVEPGMWAI